MIRAAARPTLRDLGGPAKEREYLALTSLKVCSLWLANARSYLVYPAEVVDHFAWQTLKVWDNPSDNSLQIAFASHFLSSGKAMLAMNPEDERLPAVVKSLSFFLYAQFSAPVSCLAHLFTRPAITMTISRNLIQIRESLFSQRVWISYLLSYLNLLLYQSEVSSIGDQLNHP